MNKYKKTFSELFDKIRFDLNNNNQVIKVSMPHYLYQTTEQSMAYEAATYKNESYKKNLDQPILDLIKNNMDSLCEDLTKKIYFIDLGPGYPSKSLEIIDEMKRVKHELNYYPVDVSRFFLDRANVVVGSRSINCMPLRERFENVSMVLDSKLFEQEGKRYIFLGLTYNNFEPDDINKILAQLTSKSDRCVICCQSPSGMTQNELTNPYKTNSVDSFCFYPLSEIGLKRTDFEFSVVYEDSAVRVRYMSKVDISINHVIIPKKIYFETSTSYRYDIQYIKESVEKYFFVRDIYSANKENIHVLSLQSL